MNSFDSAQRIKNVLASATRVLIMPGKNWPADTLPASLGLAQVLTSRGKEALVYFGGIVPSYISFLDFTQLRSKEWKRSQEVFDCCVAIGAEYAGTASKTVINIDMGEQAGEDALSYTAEGACPVRNRTWNMSAVSYGASSYSEAVARLVKMMYEDELPPAAATSLLAGIIAKTDNFRGGGVTPHTLFSSAYLVARGAEREKIVDAIYKQRSIPFLRLWGKFLTRVEHGNKANVAWGTLGAEDFYEIADPGSAIPTVLQELISAVPHVAVRAVFWQDGVQPNLRAVMHTNRPQVLEELLKRFNGTRHGNSLYIQSVGKSSNEIARIVSDIVSV